VHPVGFHYKEYQDARSQKHKKKKASRFPNIEPIAWKDKKSYPACFS
jgi:hypothetical protein